MRLRDRGVKILGRRRRSIGQKRASACPTGGLDMDESLRLATEVAYRILKSRERDISESSQLFTDLVEMVRGRIRGESLFSEVEIRHSYPRINNASAPLGGVVEMGSLAFHGC